MIIKRISKMTAIGRKAAPLLKRNRMLKVRRSASPIQAIHSFFAKSPPRRSTAAPRGTTAAG